MPLSPPNHTTCMMELQMDDGIVIQSSPEIEVDFEICSHSSRMADFMGEIVA